MKPRYLTHCISQHLRILSNMAMDTTITGIAHTEDQQVKRRAACDECSTHVSRMQFTSSFLTIM